MQCIGIKTRPLIPPKDSLYEALLKSSLHVKEGDIIAISSKIVSIDEGRTTPISKVASKPALVKEEADWYLDVSQKSSHRRLFTIARGTIVGSSGIDESNANGHYVLYPKDVFRSAQRIRRWLMKTYDVRTLGVVITDSTSTPLRRGAIGFALAWDGIDPLRDYRGTPDIFGRTIKIELANIADSLAAAATLVMGEGDECTPVVVMRGVKNVVFKNRSSKLEAQLQVTPENDLFAPLLWNKPWKKGGSK